MCLTGNFVHLPGKFLLYLVVYGKRENLIPLFGNLSIDLVKFVHLVIKFLTDFAAFKLDHGIYVFGLILISLVLGQNNAG